MLKEPLHSLLPDCTPRRTHSSLSLEEGFFKLFKCHESAICAQLGVQLLGQSTKLSLSPTTLG